MKQQVIPATGKRVCVKRILIPVDFTDASIRAAEYAVALARPLGATLTLLHVLETDGRGADVESPSGDVATTESALAETKLRNFARLFIGGGVATEFVVGAGRPAEQILSEMREMRPDLVVMTAAPRKSPRWWWGRDTTMDAVRRAAAACPVVVLPPVEPVADFIYL